MVVGSNQSAVGRPPQKDFAQYETNAWMRYH